MSSYNRQNLQNFFFLLTKAMFSVMILTNQSNK